MGDSPERTPLRALLSGLRWAARICAGPLAWPSLCGAFGWLAVILLWTALTEVGGAALWPAIGLAAGSQRPWRAAALWCALAHASSLLSVPPVAELFGRTALPCLGSGPLRPRSLLYCVGHRRYVRRDLAEEAELIAEEVAREHPGTIVRYLDGGFPFPGMPLLPHLSHGDGKKLDIALLYRGEQGEPIDGGGSPLGYFGYVPLPKGSRPACQPSAWDLRWDMPWLQPFVAPKLDAARTASLLRAASEREKIGKILIEPHLRERLGVDSEKIRFQGCRAARHDDHLHIQLR